MFTRWAVARGVRRLDEREPGWDERIDEAGLDLSHPCRCIVGQLYGTYGAGMRRLRLLTGLSYGFSALTPVEYVGLQREWERVLAERRGDREIVPRWPAVAPAHRPAAAHGRPDRRADRSPAPPRPRRTAQR